MKKIFSFFLVLSLLLSTSPSIAESQRYEGPGFSSPEEAVKFYLEGLKEQNLEKMLQAFAYETWAQHFDFEEYAASLGGNTSKRAGTIFPEKTDFLIAMEAQNQRAKINDLIVSSMLYYTTGCMSDGKNVSEIKDIVDKYLYAQLKYNAKESKESAEKFINSFDTDRLIALKTLHTIVTFSPEVAIQLGILPSKYQENGQKEHARQLKYLCADDLVDTFALFFIENEPYIIIPAAVRYGEKWFLLSFASAAATSLGLASSFLAMLPAPAMIESSALETLVFSTIK